MSVDIRPGPPEFRNGSDGPTALAIVKELLEAFDDGGVAYCHWKSNNALGRSLSGENDLDILVARESVPGFLAILNQRGFKEARADARWEVPSVLDFYGFDAAADRIVHLHAHYQLVLGHDYSKNYHLPIEQAFIASSVREGPFKVPSVEFELIVFVIRMMLKHATWESGLTGRTRMSPGELEELKFLQERADSSRLQQLLAQHLPSVDGKLFSECLQAINPNCPTRSRLLIARRFMRVMKVNERHSRAYDVLLKIWRRLYVGVLSRMGRGKKKRRPASGGMIVALVGGDGSGKTTCIEGLHEWLRPFFATTRIHMGKPGRSFMTTLVQGILRLGRLLRLFPYIRHDPDYENPDSALFPGYPWLIRQVLTSRDRYRCYRRARRLANRGWVVISDRFPLPQIELMDGTAERLLRAHRHRRWVGVLADIQHRYYERIWPPELLIVFRLNPDIAVIRKTDEDPRSVRARSTEIWRQDWTGTSAHLIDASASKEQVQMAVKKKVWSLL